MSTRRRTTPIAVVLAVASAAALAGGIASGAAPTTTVAPTTVAPTTVAPTTVAPTTVAATTVAPTTAAATTVVPTTTLPGVTADAVRDAKVGWSRFVTDNFATPNAILDPCPLLTVDTANSEVAALGLTPTDLPYGVSIYRDVVGVGIIGVTCGADLSKPASPAGATLFAVEVTVLDGQAVFPQYVTRVGGQNTPIERAAPELGGEMFARCRTDPQVCVAGWHFDGLIVTVKLDEPRAAESEAQVRQLLAPVVRHVLANLAVVPPGP